MPWNSTAAVLVHVAKGVTVNPAVFTILKGEENLLIHRCTARPDRKTKEWVDTAGDPVLRVDSEQSLSWDVQAGVLSQGGLANYHPGRKLSDRSLLWANGGALPFQFRMGPDAVFIYEAPVLDPMPGDLPSISFRIRAQFAELDLINYPGGGDDSGGPVVPEEPPVDPPGIPGGGSGGGGGGTGGGGVPVGFVDVPFQLAAWPFVEAIGRETLLKDVWQGLNLLGAGAFTAQLYNGNPLAPTPGTAVSAPVTLTRWTEITDDALYPYMCQAKCEAFQFSDTAAASRTATHVLFRRGTVAVGVFPLAAAFTIPAGYGARVPAGAMGLSLAWPLDNVDEDVPALLEERPWRRALGYVCGGNRAGSLPPGEIRFEAYQNLSGAMYTFAADWFWRTASPDLWAVGGDSVGPAGLGITGVAVAPLPAGYDVARIRLVMGGGLDLMILANKEYAPPFTVPANTRLLIPPGVFFDIMGVPV